MAKEQHTGKMLPAVKKVINDVLERINGDALIPEMIHSGDKKNTLHVSDLDFSITIFIDGTYARTRCFNKKTDQGVPKHILKSIENGEVLLKYPQHWRSGLAVLNKEGAFKADGLIISVAGFPKSDQNEYLAWKILNIVETRLFEINLTLGDLRFRHTTDNYLIEKERRRYGYKD